MDFTVYVLGDVSTFYNTLNSVAMVFNAKGFMTGVYLVGGFVALISGIMFVIQKGASEQFIPANGPVGGLFGFAMMVACCTIKADVKIEDIYTGTVNKVDNVPLVLAAPASLFTTTMYGLFEKITTAYQSTSGSYMAVTQNGFVTPLKLLLTLRKGVENVDPYLVASLKQYVIDCVPGSTTFSIADFQKSTNIVSYVLGHSRGTGLTTYWDNVNISGLALSCQEAQTRLDGRVGSFPSSDAAKKMINAGMKDKSPSGSAYTPDDVSAAITNLVPSLWSSAQSADDFMVNAFFFNSIVGTYNCLDSVADQNSFNLCMSSLTQQDEQFRSDAAASGSFFAKIMMPTMVFLQILFFGFAPIVIIYSLFKGAGSLMMYVKFLGFGIWTTSWLPFSAVIQMYIQNDVAEKLTEFTEKGLVPSNLKAVYYDVLATRLGIASDMLAATPLISAAMLGLTAYGMVSLASRWSGRDHNDEKLQSPDLVKNGAHVDVASRNQYQSEHSGSINNGLSLNGANWNSADLKNTLSTSTQSAFGSDHSKRSESSSAVEASLRQMSSYKSDDSWTDQRMQSLDRQHSSISQQAMKLGDSIGQALGFTGKEMNSFKEAFDAKVGFSGIFGGVSAGIQNATGKDMTKSQASTIASQFGTEISKNESDMSGWKASVADTFSHSTGREAATENALGRRLSATTADTQSSFNRFQQATSAEAGVSANAKISEETTGGNLTRSQQGMQALNQAIAGLSDSQRSEFNKKFPELETRYAQQSTGMVGARESAQLWALKSIGADTEFANVISAMTGNVVGGPSEGDASKFKGVGGKAAQISDNPAGQVSRANIGNPSMNVSGVDANQVGPTGAPQPQELREVASGMDPYRSYEDRETYVSSQLPSSRPKAQEQMRAGKTALENSDTTLSPEQIRDTMSTKPITNTMIGAGQAEQQWEQENPKTAMAVTAATMFVPGAGWGNAALKGAQAGRAVMAARGAEAALKTAEAGTEVAQAARVANAAGHEIPALLRNRGQASRVVNGEHVAEAAETAKVASATAKTAVREAAAATKLAGNVSVVPGMMIASDHMADNYNADVAANGKPERYEPGSSVRSMLQSDGATAGAQAQSGQPLVTPMPAPADALAPLGGHAGNLMAAPGENTQAAAHGQPLVTPMKANAEAPAPAPAPIRQHATPAQSNQPVTAAALTGAEAHAPIHQDAAPAQVNQPVAAAALTGAETHAPIRQDAAPAQASQPVAAAALTGAETQAPIRQDAAPAQANQPAAAAALTGAETQAPIRQDAAPAQAYQPVAAAALTGAETQAPIRQDAAPAQASQPVAAAALTGAETQAPIRQDAAPAQASQPVAAAALTGAETQAPIRQDAAPAQANQPAAAAALTGAETQAPIRQDAAPAQARLPVAAAALTGAETQAPIRQDAAPAQASLPVAAAALTGTETQAPIRQDAAPAQASQPVAAAALTGAETQAPIRQDAAPAQASQPVPAGALTGAETQAPIRQDAAPAQANQPVAAAALTDAQAHAPIRQDAAPAQASQPVAAGALTGAETHAPIRQDAAPTQANQPAAAAALTDAQAHAPIRQDAAPAQASQPVAAGALTGAETHAPIRQDAAPTQANQTAAAAALTEAQAPAPIRQDAAPAQASQHVAAAALTGAEAHAPIRRDAAPVQASQPGAAATLSGDQVHAPIRQDAAPFQASKLAAASALTGAETHAPIRQDAAPFQVSQPEAAAALTGAETHAPIRQDAAPFQVSQPEAAAALTGAEAQAPTGGHAGELRAGIGEGLMTAGANQNLMEPIELGATSVHTGQLHVGSQPALAESHTEQAGEMMTASGAGLMSAGEQSHASAGLSAGEPQLSSSDNGSGSPYGDGMMGAADAYESPFSGGGKPAPVTRVMTLEKTVVNPEDKGDDDAKPPTTRGGKS